MGPPEQAGASVGLGPGFVGAHKEPPRTARFDLVLGWAVSLIPSEVRWSFYSPSLMRDVSLCWAGQVWGRSNRSSIFLNILNVYFSYFSSSSSCFYPSSLHLHSCECIFTCTQLLKLMFWGERQGIEILTAPFC